MSATLSSHYSAVTVSSHLCPLRRHRTQLLLRSHRSHRSSISTHSYACGKFEFQTLIHSSPFSDHMPRCFYQKYQKCPCHIIHSSTSHRCKLEQTVWMCQIIIFQILICQIILFYLNMLKNYYFLYEIIINN